MPRHPVLPMTARRARPLRPVLIAASLARLLVGSGALGTSALRGVTPSPAPPPVTFDTGFEDASLGQIEVLGPDRFRLHVAGQCDEHGHNRQANWFYFRMGRGAGRDLTLILTDLVGEYDNTPGNVALGPTTRPVFSEDGRHWRHISRVSWDSRRKEMTLRISPNANTIWVATVPPYPYSRLCKLLAECNASPCARVEVIGRTVFGRSLDLVTVTNFARPDDAKRKVWLIAREHAWESGTSFAAEGALRFITSDDPRACQLRDQTVFKIIPMADPDGCSTGKVRFNAHGYDFNRNWERVDLRDKRWLQAMPEIWYMKKAILADQARRPIDLLVNLHNNEDNEYMESMVTSGPELAMLRRFFRILAARSSFDPSRPDVTVEPHPSRPTTEVLWPEDHVPVVLVEQRIALGRKLGHLPTPEDRSQFGRDLIAAMAQTVP